MEYLIDITGTCNLRCPSCPVGNFNNNQFIGTPRPKGFMEFSYFEKVIEKLIKESEADSTPAEVHLYNWGESLIHPEIYKFVDLLNSRKIPFHISSNLNNEIDLRPIIKAEPKTFRVSLSGGSNPVYQKGHKGGDINLVISNLYKIKHLSTKINTPIKIHVAYHLYRDNVNADLMKIFNICKELDIPFLPSVAYFMPIEKVMYRLMRSDKFTPQDEETMSRMWVSIEESLDIANNSQDKSCTLQENQIVINHDGAVPICCGVYDPTFFITKDYLQIERGDLMEKRRNFEFCSMCTDYGIHNVLVYKPQHLWSATVLEKQKAAGLQLLTSPFEKTSLFLNEELTP